jgi:hypothetical protein
MHADAILAYRECLALAGLSGGQDKIHNLFCHFGNNTSGGRQQSAGFLWARSADAEEQQ